MNLKDIIKRPVITEKAINQTAFGEYTFAVNWLAAKGQIKEAIEKFFGVDVVGMRTIKVKGKTIRRGRKRLRVKLPDWKKAIVKIKEGQKIEYFEMGGKK